MAYNAESIKWWEVLVVGVLIFIVVRGAWIVLTNPAALGWHL